MPFFEPQNVTTDRGFSNARLPLFEEYDGLCHARPEEPARAPSDMLFRGCNQGYSQYSCRFFPPGKEMAAVRYSVTRQTDTRLEFLCIEETGFTPVRWHALQYLKATDVLETEGEGLCIRAQALAFCRNYVQQQTKALVLIEDAKQAT